MSSSARQRVSAAVWVIVLTALTGCEVPEAVKEPPPPGTSPVVDTPMPVPAPAASEPRHAAGEEVDLIGDKPGTAVPAKASKRVLIEELKPSDEPLGQTAAKAYQLLAGMKTNLDLISADLDNQGKEVTRLIRTSDLLAGNITDLANLWAANESFRDICGCAKARVLVLNEELSRVPRKWANVRWAYNSVVQDVRKLRRTGRDLAEAEPKPVAVPGKDGKTRYVEQVPAVDPALAEKERRMREMALVRERLKRAEELRNSKPMPVDLDSK